MAGSIPVTLAATGIPITISGITPGSTLTIAVTNATALQVENGSNVQIFNVDTSTPLVQVGNDTTGVSLKLDGPAATPSRLQFYRAGALDWQIGLIANSDDLRFLSNTTAILDINASTGAFERYAKVATVGLGVPALYGLDNRSGLTAADGAATTLYTTTAAGQLYRITADIFATAYTSGTATYTVTWTEHAVTRTLVVTATALNTLATGTDLINPDSGTAITAQLTGVFTATVTVAAVVEQIA